jgi:dynein heavy chain, axonemal
MSYGHRSMMRAEFVRFLRLAYLLDFICVQSLGQIYINSAVDFYMRISKIAHLTIRDKVIGNQDQFIQEIDPAFFIEFEVTIGPDLKNFDFEVVEMNGV